MSGVYNKSANGQTAKAPIRRFSLDEMAKFRENRPKNWKIEESIEKKTKKSDEIKGTDEKATPNPRSEPTSKVSFTRLLEAKKRSEWEDVGSETDYSDHSEGHYSDENEDEKREREQRNETKYEKRTQRMIRINKKFNI